MYLSLTDHVCTSFCRHSSFGTLSLCLLFPRIAVRLASKVPAPPAGNWYMQCLGGISHIAMYGFAVGLPVTGFAMGTKFLHPHPSSPHIVLSLSLSLSPHPPCFPSSSMLPSIFRAFRDCHLCYAPYAFTSSGYVGGKGVPFFYKTITPMSGEFGKAKNGKLAGNMYKIHTQMGYMFKFFVPVHVGAVGLHALKGQNLLARITPFFK
jgi:cytochrome b561